MRPIVLAALPLLLLAGCSGGSGNNSSSAVGEPQPQAPENLVEDPFNMASPYTPPSPSPVAGLPATFDGRWATLEPGCTSGTGLLVVSGGSATLDGAPVIFGDLDTRGGNAVSAHVKLPGQQAHGERWSVSGDGRQLIRQRNDPTKAMIYNRCPA